MKSLSKYILYPIFILQSSIFQQYHFGVQYTEATITLIGSGKYYATIQEKRFGNTLSYGVEYVARLQSLGLKRPTTTGDGSNLDDFVIVGVNDDDGRNNNNNDDDDDAQSVDKYLCDTNKKSLDNVNKRVKNPLMTS